MSLIMTGLAATFVIEFAGLAVAAEPENGEPVLVVAPPWRGGAEEVVQSAGGTLVGPTKAPLSVLAADASAEDLRAAGAWFLLDPNKLAFLCASGTS